MKTWLLDTGPLVAYLDPRDSAHGEVTTRLDDFRGQLATTSAVITEAMHFVAAAPDGPALLTDLLAATGTQAYDFSRPEALRRAVELMAKYGDTPMDYADATLLLLADQLAIFDILTLDRRGFTIFRTPRGRVLNRVLDDD